MAKIIGESGFFQAERSLNRRLNALLGLMLVMILVSFVCGYLTANQNVWLLVAVFLTAPALIYMKKRFEEQIRDARREEDGADGERAFEKYVMRLPDAYTVICDLDFVDSYGNIDHLIVGPKGVFAVDVKNWRGTVTPDGNNELLLNGKPLDKPQIKYFTRRVMNLRERINALTKLDPFIQCVFAFLRTNVAANWGTTGAVHCISADNICGYIEKYKPAVSLSQEEQTRIIKAVEALKSLSA